MIAVIDYGMGNLRSVQKALEAVGAQAVITGDPQKIRDARSVVLPGVGAFRDCMDNLERFGLVEVVKETVRSGKPFLGICLGLQLLFHQSEEFGQAPGLEILPGSVVGFAANPPGPGNGGFALKIPHMGWNRVRFKKDNLLFNSVPDNSYFYFVHSFYVVPENPEVIATTTDYGGEFVSGIHKDNLFAVQFHPEKSQALGLTVLKNFARIR